MILLLKKANLKLLNNQLTSTSKPTSEEVAILTSSSTNLTLIFLMATQLFA
jgi:hypothetical protein